MKGINVNDVDIIVQLRLQDGDFICESDLLSGLTLVSLARSCSDEVR